MSHRNIYELSLKYGMILVTLLMGFKTFEYALFSFKIPVSIYLGIVVLSFLGIGTWMGLSFYGEEKLISNRVTDKQPLPEKN